LIIDAIIGYSLNSAPRGNAQKMITWTNKQSAKILSLDVPSGVNSTTGEIYGEFIKADRTLTLALPKTGLLTKLTGELFLADIGIPQAIYSKIGVDYVEPFGNNYVIKIKLDK
jgi:NAD(P)H-hydrate epimerase